MVENECFTTDFLRILCNLAVVFNGLKPSMYVHIHGEKKAQKFSPPAAGETPDPCHLSGPEMISYTFRHHTPSDTVPRRCGVGQTRKRVWGVEEEAEEASESDEDTG